MASSAPSSKTPNKRWRPYSAQLRPVGEVTNELCRCTCRQASKAMHGFMFLGGCIGLRGIEERALFVQEQIAVTGREDKAKLFKRGGEQERRMSRTEIGQPAGDTMTLFKRPKFKRKNEREQGRVQRGSGRVKLEGQYGVRSSGLKHRANKVLSLGDEDDPCSAPRSIFYTLGRSRVIDG